MKNLARALVLSFLGVVFVAGSASALPMSFSDVHYPDPNIWLDASNNAYSYEHDINDNGYNSATDSILSANLLMYLYDDSDQDASECVTVEFDSNFQQNFEVETCLYKFDVEVSMLDDGVLLVDLAQTHGDFGLGLSVLNVEVDRVEGGLNAPEPATMLLFGTGLIGMAAVGRKKFFNKS